MFEKKEILPTNASAPSQLRGRVGKGVRLNKLLNEHERLKMKRHPMFERNRFMKFLMWFMVLYYAAIFIMMGVVLPAPMSQAYHGVAAFHVLDGYFLVIVIVDFWMRFILQETPANEARPYSLLPIPRSFLMRRYLVRAGLSWGNLFWGTFLLPFAFVSVYTTLTLWATIGWLIGWWLLFVLNSYIYLIIRALCTRKIWWFLLPLIIHLALVAVMFVPQHNLIDMPCTLFMYGFAKWQLWPFVLVLALIALFFRLNEWVQGSILYSEIGKQEDVTVKSSTQMNFLNRFGIVGEYLKLELKMKWRNRSLKMQTFMLIGCMLLLSGLLYFTDIYDGAFMTSFIVLYDYIVPGMTVLVTIMCHEGNYIDGLMSRRESILDLLTAKYYFNSAILLLPFCLLIPLNISGKVPFLMSLGYLFFTVGLLYPVVFQMVRWNKETLPLNAKLTGKQASTAQNIIMMAIMFAPIAIERLSVLLLGPTWGYVLLILLGAIGIVMHRRWLRATYNQFMKHRYVNMEGFRASRK